MQLKTVFVRFYKSFNFDYLRKFDPNVTCRYPWEVVDDLWYPYVRVPIDAAITTVVGANESGKTHLLTAIEKGISGDGIERADFCRHSRFFTVEEGKMKWPDYGFEWSDVTAEERRVVAECCGITKPVAFESFYVFRTDKTKLAVFLPDGQNFNRFDVPDKNAATLRTVVPHVFRLRENIGLPESAPIRWLAGNNESMSQLEQLSRYRRVTLFENFLSHPTWFTTKQTVTQAADEIVTAFGNDNASGQSMESSETDDSADAAELKLAYDLIRNVAKIDGEALSELHQALRDGRDAFANSIIDSINDRLDAVLNFPRWWVQDKDFRLLVSPRDYDLVFTIRDRTGREYSFGERSSGLKYFLSYYIQYLAHECEHGRREILLMDEPDAFLSHQGQQDLLKIFDEFAKGNGSDRPPTQVIYVTHSPFLIDKNHSERIRVLDKGVGEEGTRVVRNASRNHYEPLRSAFGSFVAETTFISHCNLMVEGPADQILLAGAATFLRSRGASELETLDLNKITIVPAGGEGHVPYLVYLARGRDVEKPAVIVFLDSDAGGNNAKKGLERGGAKNRQILKPKFVFQVGQLSEPSDGFDGLKNAAGKSLVEVEDLIPLPIGVEATRRYLVEFCQCPEEIVNKVSETAIRTCFGEESSLFDAISQYLSSLSEGLHIEKVGFARMTVDVVCKWSTATDSTPGQKKATADFADNMKTLFRKLRQMQREAEREFTTGRVSRRVERAKQSFIQDNPTGAKREHAYLLLEEIESSLDNTDEGDVIRAELSSIRREFKIDEDVTEAVPDYDRFKDRIEKLQYAATLASQESEQSAFGSNAIASVAPEVRASPKPDDDGASGEGAVPEESASKEDPVTS